jgi:hypothetical protein
VVDRHSLPLSVTVSAANVHDSKMLEVAMDTIPPLRFPGRRQGRPRTRPTKLHADKAMTSPGGGGSRGRRKLFMVRQFDTFQVNMFLTGRHLYALVLQAPAAVDHLVFLEV